MPEHIYDQNDLIAMLHWQFEIATRQEVAGLGVVHVSLNKIIARNTVAICKYQVIATGSDDSFVHNHGLLESIVLLPDVFEIHVCLGADSFD